MILPQCCIWLPLVGSWWEIHELPSWLSKSFRMLNMQKIPQTWYLIYKHNIGAVTYLCLAVNIFWIILTKKCSYCSEYPNRSNAVSHFNYIKSNNFACLINYSWLSSFGTWKSVMMNMQKSLHSVMKFRQSLHFMKSCCCLWIPIGL